MGNHGLKTWISHGFPGPSPGSAKAPTPGTFSSKMMQHSYGDFTVDRIELRVSSKNGKSEPAKGEETIDSFFN